MRWIVLIMLSLLVTGCGPKKVKPGDSGIAMGDRKPIPAVPKRVEMAIDPKLVEKARAEIKQAAESENAIERAHGLEAMKNVYLPEYEKTILFAMQDGSALVRKSAAMAAGELKLQSAKDRLIQLEADPNLQVCVAVRYALHRLGDNRRSQDLGIYATDQNKGVRADTALVLGMLGEPSAERILTPMWRDREPIIRLQVAEALWRLNRDERALEELIAATVSSYPDYQMFAYAALPKAKDNRVIEHLRVGLVSDYLEASLVCARSMGELGSDAGYGVAIKGAESKDKFQKQLGALAFGAIGRSDAQPYLGKLLDDKDESVRLAAAIGLLKLKSPQD